MYNMYVHTSVCMCIYIYIYILCISIHIYMLIYKERTHGNMNMHKLIKQYCRIITLRYVPA